MKTFKHLTAFSSLLLLLLVACVGATDNNKLLEQSKNEGGIEVIQFHSEHRCMTCNKIESLTKETLKSYPTIPFVLVNVDDKKNAKKAEQFEAAGTALFLYNPKTGKKKELTDFAFMHAGNKEKFMQGLKKEIDLFLKS
jgi:hypothetical protein